MNEVKIIVHDVIPVAFIMPRSMGNRQIGATYQGSAIFGYWSVDHDQCSVWIVIENQTYRLSGTLIQESDEDNALILFQFLVARLIAINVL